MCLREYAESKDTKINSAVDALIIIWGKFSEQVFLERHRTFIFVSCLNSRLMLRQLTEENSNGDGWLNDYIFTRCKRCISVCVFRTVLCSLIETRSRINQASKLEPLASIVNSFELTLLTIFSKSFIEDVWRFLNKVLISSNAGN